MTRTLLFSALLLLMPAVSALAWPGGPYSGPHRGYGPPAGDMRPGPGYHRHGPPPMRHMGPPPHHHHRMPPPPPPPRYYYPQAPVVVVPMAPSGALNLNPLPGVELSLYW